jgi:hypothetical protein
MRLYVDGVMKAESTEQSGDIQYAHVPEDEFVIGSFRDLDEDHRHDGGINDVALWDRALSAGQVASLYSTPSTTTVCEIIACKVSGLASVVDGASLAELRVPQSGARADQTAVCLTALLRGVLASLR